MPRLSIILIRTSLVYLGIGFTLGALLLINKAILVHPRIWQFLPAHQEAALVGWIVQLVMGVAFWMLPRVGLERRNEMLVWAAAFCLNGGIILVCMDPFTSGSSLPGLGGRILEFLAAALFAIHVWPRIRAFGE